MTEPVQTQAATTIEHDAKYDAQFAELRTHQLKAVEVLKQVDAICTAQKIEYFMIAGSTLGAIRHQGFIPWDDDIDIGMTLPNYNRFCAQIPALLQKPYCWSHTDVNPAYPTLSGRISLGEEPLMTVFPIIKLSDVPAERQRQWRVRKVISPVWQRKVHYHVPAERITTKDHFAFVVSSLMGCFLSKKKTLQILRDNESRYEGQKTEWYINLYSKYSMEKESIRAEWIADLVRVPYEGGMYPVFRQYDAYLTHLYGDYHALPPIAQRVPAHI